MARVQREKVLKIDRPFRAGGFLSLTGPWGPRVVVAASPQIKKRGAASAAGCVEGLRKKVLRIDGSFRAQGFLSLTGPLAPRVADCRSAAMLIKSALRDLLFCVIGLA